MPRDGSSIYHRPPGTDGIPDTSIESAKYNTYVADVEQDLNLPRPIIAGGTGATNAYDARIAMTAEVAGQTVTNYDSQVWENGSFWSGGSATGGPVDGHSFGGSCVILNHDPNYIVLEAHDITDSLIPGRNYIREKRNGSWGAWYVEGRTIVGNSEGIGGVNADMFFGVTGVAPNSAFIVNNKADVSGTTILSVNKNLTTTLVGSLNVYNAPYSFYFSNDGRVISNGADGFGSVTFTGLTRGVRFNFDNNGTSIDGINQLSSSYQPIELSGSLVTLRAHSGSAVLGVNSASVDINSALNVVGRVTTNDTLRANPAAGAAFVELVPNQTGQQALVNFYDSGTLKWQAGQHLDGSWIVGDNAGGAFPIQIVPAGDLFLNPKANIQFIKPVYSSAGIIAYEYININNNKSFDSVLYMGSTVAGKSAYTYYQDAGVSKWNFGKWQDNSFGLSDAVGGVPVWQAFPNSDLYFSPKGAVVINKNTPASSSEYVQSWQWAGDPGNWGLRLAQRHTGSSLVYDFLLRWASAVDNPVMTFSGPGPNVAFGAGAHLNFNVSLIGAAGYGIRDNAGVIEVKNSGGAWAPISVSGWAPVINARLAFAGDSANVPATMTEPYAGAVMTGMAFHPNSGNPYAEARWRYMQIQTTAWFTIPYV